MKKATAKSLAKTAVLDASDNPDDQDEARKRRVKMDFASWRKQTKSGKTTHQEEVGISSSAKMKDAQKEAELRKKEEAAVKKAKKVNEAKVDTGSADEKAKARNLRNTPPGADKDTDLKTFITRKPGESLEKARQRVRQRKHAERRGVKEETIDELNRYGKETGKATGSLNKRPGSPVKGNQNKPNTAMSTVRRNIRKETGRPEGQQKKKRGAKVDPQAYGQPETSVQKIKKYLEKKRAIAADPSQGRYPPGSTKD